MAIAVSSVAKEKGTGVAGSAFGVYRRSNIKRQGKGSRATERQGKKAR